jgi:hypothetical protein
MKPTPVCLGPVGKRRNKKYAYILSLSMELVNVGCYSCATRVLAVGTVTSFKFKRPLASTDLDMAVIQYKM